MSEWKVEKIMKKMAKKKSKGKDGISQECLLLGQEALAAPITAIIFNNYERFAFFSNVNVLQIL